MKKYLIAASILLVIALIFLAFDRNKKESLDTRFDGIPEKTQAIESTGTYRISMENDIEVVKLPSGATIRMDANRYGASYGNPSQTTETEEPHIVLGDDYPESEFFSINGQKEVISHDGFSYQFTDVECNEVLDNDTDVQDSYVVTDCSFTVLITEI